MFTGIFQIKTATSWYKKIFPAGVIGLTIRKGYDFEKDGMMVSDGDISSHSRPQLRKHMLIGSENPEFNPRERVDDEKNYNRGFTEQADIANRAIHEAT